MKIGYARVSTKEQNISLQVDALEKAGCQTIYQEKITGASKQQPQPLVCCNTFAKVM